MTGQDALGTTIASEARGWDPPSLPEEVMTNSNNRAAVEMTLRGNHKTISTGAWKSRTEREIPTFPQARISLFQMRRT
jgi:hypothetical protein